MADAEKKDIAKLSFNVQDARQGLLEIGSLLDDLSKKSTTTFDKISKEFKDSFSNNVVDVKKIKKAFQCFSCLGFIFFFVFLGPHSQHMEVPRLSV